MFVAIRSLSFFKMYFWFIGVNWRFIGVISSRRGCKAPTGQAAGDSPYSAKNPMLQPFQEFKHLLKAVRGVRVFQRHLAAERQLRRLEPLFCADLGAEDAGGNMAEEFVVVCHAGMIPYPYPAGKQ